MKVDVLFYSIFQKHLKLLFQLIGQPDADPSRYSFVVHEVKQLSFRFDGILEPLTPGDTLYFVEVQFQKKPIYSRLFAEINLYLHQYNIKNDWLAIVFFKSRSTEIPPLDHQAVEIDRRVVRIYLDELGDLAQRSVGIAILRLLPILSKKKIKQEIQALLAQAAQQNDRDFRYEQAVELIQEILTLKFPDLGAREVAMLIGLEEERKKTRFYQEVSQEVREEILSRAVPALVKAKYTPEQISQELNVDLETVHRIIRQSQEHN